MRVKLNDGEWVEADKVSVEIPAKVWVDGEDEEHEEDVTLFYDFDGENVGMGLTDGDDVLNELDQTVEELASDLMSDDDYDNLD